MCNVGLRALRSSQLYRPYLPSARQGLLCEADIRCRGSEQKDDIPV